MKIGDTIWKRIMLLAAFAIADIMSVVPARILFGCNRGKSIAVQQIAIKHTKWSEDILLECTPRTNLSLS